MSWQHSWSGKRKTKKNKPGRRKRLLPGFFSIEAFLRIFLLEMDKIQWNLNFFHVRIRLRMNK